MNGFAALGIVLGLVAVVAAGGLVWRATTGRARTLRAREAVRPGDVGADAFGAQATLLQFSTELCSPCRSTARVLAAAAVGSDGVRHVEIDVTRRPELADRFHLLQTPTTLILDASGTVRARIGGTARPDAVHSALRTILRSNHVSA
ncbi:thioredoxin family protein [Leifsonia sp. fls2-241-R2A-40a]|uniref:TlpA family protein disulfide reductase n=1 Tax=Leifsonia sp. fls2-241-R2A-40a TaxID=3040290 RepID=UPI00254F5F5C|nr:thioredoxin family protein [Leifsonia sp. fls2-241-R2A-40a]